MKQGFIVLILVLIFVPRGFSQKYDKDLFEKDFYIAENLVEKGDFQNALLVYKDLLKMDPDNANLNFKIGFCYLNTVLEKSQSISYLTIASKNVYMDAQPENHLEKAAPIETYLYLAEAYHLNYQFQKAIDILDTLKMTVPNYSTEFTTNIDKLIENCKNGIELMKYPVKMFVTNLGGTINSEYDEHSPVISADESTLIFTSKRKSGSDAKMTEDGQYFEDIYISQKKSDGLWSEPVSISPNINTPGHEASIGLSVDGQELFIYKDESNMVNEKDGNIYYSKLNGDVWSKPVKLGPTINTKYNENHASISADGTELYFTSDRPGGFGGMDIYMSKKLPNGEWGEARNLGNVINTPEDEIGPYIHPDGVTLFFSSKGHRNMGGFDIFFSSKDENGVWAEPTNIGYPINTPSDDVFYMPTPDGLRAYYASEQTGGIGRNDLYLITLPESEEKSLTVMSGIITMADGTPPSDVSITVTDMDTKEVVGSYTPNSKTGKYLFILKSGKNYSVTIDAKNFLPFTDNLYVKEGTSYQQIQKAVKLDPIILGQLTKDYYYHFTAGSTELNDKEANTLITVAKILQFANQYKAEIILPKDNDNKDLNNIRAEILSENLTDHKVAEDKIKVLSTPTGINESIRLFIITDKEDKLALKNNATNQNNQTNNNANNLTTQNNTNNQTNNQNVNKDVVATNQTTQTNNQNSNKDIVATNQTSTGNALEITCVFYNFDKSSAYSYTENINKLAQWLVANPEAAIEIIGNTDSKGSAKYNKKLSLRRANFIKKQLVSKGVSSKAIKTYGLGKSKPVSINKNIASRKFNRRVEFKLTKEGKTPIVFKPVDVPDEYKIK